MTHAHTLRKIADVFAGLVKGESIAPSKVAEASAALIELADVAVELHHAEELASACARRDAGRALLRTYTVEAVLREHADCGTGKACMYCRDAEGLEFAAQGGVLIACTNAGECVTFLLERDGTVRRPRREVQ